MLFASILGTISKNFFSKGRSKNRPTNTGLKRRVRKKLAEKNKPVANVPVQQKKVQSVSLK
jgi:hypothetical protein